MKWPNTTDAQIWAREWLATPNHMEQADDEGAMIAWFANAIMAGWDTACQNHEENVKHLEGRVKFWEESYELSRKQLLKSDEIISALATEVEGRTEKMNNFTEDHEKMMNKAHKYDELCGEILSSFLGKKNV